MNIYTKHGELPVTLSTFPDGQPHFMLGLRDDSRTATIETAIVSPRDLFDVLMAKDVLSQGGYRVALDIRYLMGARMDRHIDVNQPFTLALVSRLLMSAGFSSIRVLDPHSEVSTRLLNAKAVMPFSAVSLARNSLPLDTVIVVPDKGAQPRVEKLIGDGPVFVFGEKHRDMSTGRITGLTVGPREHVMGAECLILDDICDGGATFSGLATILLEQGAKAVHLFVTHGLFTKGLDIKGLSKIFTTDSVCPLQSTQNLSVLPIRMQDIR